MFMDLFGIKKLQSKITALENEKKELERERNAYREQLTLEIKKLTPMTETIHKYKEGEDALSLWLRNNRMEEIARGDHSGKSLQAVIIGYLASGLRAEKEGVSIPVNKGKENVQ